MLDEMGDAAARQFVPRAAEGQTPILIERTWVIFSVKAEAVVENVSNDW
jgi:hypothetical protein